MIGFYDIAYALAIAIAAPIWLVRPRSRRKVFAAFRERMGRVPQRTSSSPAVLIHAVSLGEVNATRALVDRLRARRPDLEFIISTTTATGFDRARSLYGGSPGTMLIRYPLDFTAAVTRLLDCLRPSVVVLMELEVWPNFARLCEKRGIPLIVINARLTPGSYRNYRLGRPLVKRMFRRVAVVCAQDQTYADRFARLGMPRQRLRVTGTMKFDNATLASTIPGADELASALGLVSGQQKIWVCGSTGPGEEALVLRVLRSLLGRCPDLRLVIVPRHPERFDPVAALIQSAGFTCLRRSEAQRVVNAPTPVILGDTMGELRKFYALADIVFVGRSLVDLGPRQHGSDMIEPAALARPILVGPFTQNFAEPMRRFREAHAIQVVADEKELRQAVESLLSDRARAAEMGRRAADVVRANQGATDRHVEVIVDLLESQGRTGEFAAMKGTGARL